MFNAIKNIYRSEDLHGECLLQPLKMYHSFIAKKVEGSSGLKQVLRIIVKIVTPIFAYSCFGVLAGVGMLIKLTGIPGLKKHNQCEKDCLASSTALELESQNSGLFFEKLGNVSEEHGRQMRVLQSFPITKRTEAGPLSDQFAKIYQAIDSLSGQFKKIHIRSHGSIDRTNNTGEITVDLRAWERTH